jgi:hypothetical protein
MSFFQPYAQKPSQYNINKGSVKLVNSSENFWVKYPSEVSNFVNCSISNGVLNVEALKDNIDIIVNLNQLQTCNVNLTAGLLDVNHICKNSNMALGSGTMKVHVDKTNSGVIKAHVDVGILNNYSDLNVQNQLNYFQSNQFGFGNFMPFGGGMNNDISLTGDISDYTAAFKVGSGTLELGL